MTSSTIDPTVPAFDAPFLSQPVRNNFLAAYNDINALWSHVGNSLPFGPDTGVANAYVATVAPTVTTLTDGLSVSVKIGHVNTGISTLNINGTGALPVTMPNGGRIAQGTLTGICIFSYSAAANAWQYIGTPTDEVSVLQFFPAAAINDTLSRGGLVDVTAYIQNAVNAAQGTGKILCFPAGTYKVTAQINVTQPLRLRGDSILKAWITSSSGVLPGFASSGTVILDYTVPGGGNTAIFYVTVSNFWIESFDFTSMRQSLPGPGWTPTTTVTAIQVQGAYISGGVAGDMPTIRDVIVRGMTQGVVVVGPLERVDIRMLLGQTWASLLYLDGVADIPYVESVHHWPLWSVDNNVVTWTCQNTAMMHLGRVDGGFFNNIFGIDLAAGIEFYDGLVPSLLGTTTYAAFNGVYFDATRKAFSSHCTANHAVIMISNMVHYGFQTVMGNSDHSVGITDAPGTQSMDVYANNVVTSSLGDAGIYMGNLGGRLQLNNFLINSYNAANSSSVGIYIGTGSAAHLGVGEVINGQFSAPTTGGAGTFTGTFFGGTGSVNITPGTGITTTPNPLTGTGTVALAGFNNGYILANFSGVNGNPPTPTLLNDILDADFGNPAPEGSILYRGATQWTTLSPGTSGQLLASQGAGADPHWITASGTGTVTSVATGTGLTGGPITGSGTISLAGINNGEIMANYSGSNGVPPGPTSVNTILDATFGNPAPEGSIIFRAASGWSSLTPGIAGQLLRTGGPSADPSWVSASGTGTVTSVGSGTGLTGGPITTSGSLALAGINNGNILANFSGTNGVAPSPTTLNTILDVSFGNPAPNGSVIYRGPSSWTTLTGGSTGQMMVLNSSGDPVWTNSLPASTPINFDSSANSYINANGGGVMRLHSSFSIGADTPVFTSYVDNSTHLGTSGNAWIDVWAHNGTIQTSDMRAKEAIEDCDLGLAFIEALRPVSFARKGDDEKHRHYGLLAQEVEAVLDGKDFAGLIKPETEDEQYGLVYTEVVAPLIRAVQELSARVRDLENQLSVARTPTNGHAA